jgi:tetratricopeptide (TPR) repeat protein
MPDVVQGRETEVDSHVSNSGSRGGFGFRTRGALEGAEKEFPIPQAWEVANKEIEWRRREVGANPLDADDHLAMAQLLAAVGSPGEAKEHIERAVALGIDSPVNMVHLAQVYALLGEKERALEELARAVAADYPDPYLPLVLPAFRSLHSDPRFSALFEVHERVGVGVGLPENDPSVIVNEELKTDESGGSNEEWW